MVSRSKNLGKWFEQVVQDELDKLRNTRKCTYVRLYDTTSAGGNYIPEQPGDFIVVPRAFSGAILLECKASKAHTSLKGCLSSNVKRAQAAQHMIWQSVNQPCWFLFFSETTNTLELWDGGYVAGCRSAGRTLGKKAAARTMEFSRLPELLLEIIT